MMSLLTLLFGICIMILFSDWGHLNLFVIITIILFSGAFIFDIARLKKYKIYALPLLIGYFLRVFLLFYDVYSNNPLRLPLVASSFTTSDPYWFFRSAVQYSQGYEISYGGFFSKFLGVIFSVTGASRLWGEFIVLLFSLATILVLISLLNELDIKSYSKTASVYLICLFPNYAFLSVVMRRETIITFFLGLSLLNFVRWIRNRIGEKGFWLSVVFALIASLFHGAVGVIIVCYIIVRIIYNPKTKIYAINPKRIVSACLFFLLVLLLFARFGAVFFNKVEQRMEAGVYSSTRDAGGSSYAQYVGDASNPVNVLTYAVPRYIYFMFSPLPWQWRGASDIIAFFLSSCIYLLILVNTIRCIRISNKTDENRKILIALFCIALLMASIFSWGVTNTGTATRHRDKFIVLYVAMFALSNKTRIRFKINDRN